MYKRIYLLLNRSQILSMNNVIYAELENLRHYPSIEIFCLFISRFILFNTLKRNAFGHLHLNVWYIRQLVVLFCFQAPPTTLTFLFVYVLVIITRYTMCIR